MRRRATGRVEVGGVGVGAAPLRPCLSSLFDGAVLAPPSLALRRPISIISTTASTRGRRPGATASRRCLCTCAYPASQPLLPLWPTRPPCGHAPPHEGATIGSRPDLSVRHARLGRTDVEEGGETVFPNSQKAPDDTGAHAFCRGQHTTVRVPSPPCRALCTASPTLAVPARSLVALTGDWSQCASRGVAVKPRQGDALLFFSMDVRARFSRPSRLSSPPSLAARPRRRTPLGPCTHAARPLIQQRACAF